MPATETHNIVEPLLRLKVPVGSLDTMPGNPRRGEVDAVARSLQVYGQRKPVTVKRTSPKGGIVTAGNHTLLAARALGWTHVAAVVLDDDDVTAKGWALADNRTHDLGGYDQDALMAMLEDVQGAGVLEGTGFSDEDVADLSARLAKAAEPSAPSVGLGTPVISTTLVFDTEQQQQRWYAFVKMLRQVHPDLRTLAERLVAHIDALSSDGSLPDD